MDWQWAEPKLGRWACYRVVAPVAVGDGIALGVDLGRFHLAVVRDSEQTFIPHGRAPRSNLYKY
jgi:hypothetical protein